MTQREISTSCSAKQINWVIEVMSKTSVLVRLEKADRGRIDMIAAELQGEGLEVTEKMSTTGIIAGTVDELAIDRLRRVGGVAQVRPEGRFQLPPVDENIPQ